MKISLDLSKVINFITKVCLEGFIVVAGLEIAKSMISKSESEVATYLALSLIIPLTILFIVKVWKKVEFIK